MIELLKKHGLDECVSMSTLMETKRLDADLQGTPTDQTNYRRMIGGLMHLTASRPYIAFATFLCARYQARPMVKHLKEVKRIFWYLRQSYNMGLWYLKDSGFELIAYSDADHAGCKDDCKSTSGGLQFLGGKIVSWSSKKQDCTAMSTAEAEYVSLFACCAQVIWMRTQLLDYGYKYNRISMCCDSKSAIAISCNPVQHSKTKHIDIRCHFIKEHVEKGTIELYFVGTEYQLADLFTKALPKERFEYLFHHIVIIMAQQQHAAEVHPDELCPPNKQYDLMDANKKVDLDHFWHTLKEEGSKYRLTFMLDKKELSLTLDDFRTIFYLPHANADNHDSFVTPPSFLGMVPFFKQQLGFTIELKTSSSFNTIGLLQPWKTLCKILLWRYKDKVGMQIPDWMISEEMKHTEHYRMYAEVFGLDVPLTQSQPTESTQGTHRTLSAPRRSTRLTPPAPVPTVDKADEMILQDTLQVSLAEHKSREEQEARENVELVKEHLASVEIEKMVEGSENVIDDSLLPRNDESKIPGTRLEPRSDKESPEVEITNDEEVEITNVVIPVNVNEEEEEITDEVYELKRREKGKIVEESRSTPFPTPIRSPRIHTDLVSSDTEKLQELTGRYTYLFEHLKTRFLSRKSFDTLADHLQEVMVESLPTMVDTHIKEQVKKQVPEQNAIDNHIPSQVDASVRSYMSGHILHVHPVQSQTPSVPEQQYQLYLSMKNDPQLQQQDIAIWLALQMKFENLQVPQTTCRPSAVRPRDQDDPHDDAHPEGENRAKRQKTSEYEAYVSGESSSGQVNENEQGPSTLGNQEQEDDYDFWTESYASDDDEIPTEQMSQDIMEEVSLTINEAKLKKMVDEMLRQRCTSGDEHQYHIDQMKNFLKSDIVWESRKEILVSPHPRKTTPLVQSCQRDPEAPPLSLINQDLLYLKKGSSGPEKIVLSLHKFPAVIFINDDIEE
ncbi:hypothetical protein Tco_1230146 [Tanacetum coccineum]